VGYILEFHPNNPGSTPAQGNSQKSQNDIVSCNKNNSNDIVSHNSHNLAPRNSNDVASNFSNDVVSQDNYVINNLGTTILLSIKLLVDLAPIFNGGFS